MAGLFCRGIEFRTCKKLHKDQTHCCSTTWKEDIRRNMACSVMFEKREVSGKNFLLSVLPIRLTNRNYTMNRQQTGENIPHETLSCRT